MLRAVLLGLLTLSAVSCKSHDESQAKSQPGVAAGKVVEVTGTVTLHHGTETRPLAKGDVVDADDVVETGADGSAVIEVQHNNVNWEIGASKKGTLRESLAWTQPKKDKAAKATEEDSAAAGRHAERNAAESSATANERAQDTAEEEKADKKAEAAPAKAATAPAPKAAPAKAAAPPPKPEPAMAPQAESAMAPPAAQAPAPPAVQAPAPPPPPPPPKTVSRSRSIAPPSPGATADEGGLGLTGTGAGGGGTGDGSGGLGAVGTIGKGGGTSTAQSLVNAKKAKLQACVKSGTTMRLKIDVDASGKANVLFLDKRDWPDATTSCVKKVIEDITFSKETASVLFTIKV